MQVYLETERLVLRRFTKADVDNLFELDSNQDVMRFLTGGKPTPRDVIQNETLPRIQDAHGERYQQSREQEEHDSDDDGAHLRENPTEAKMVAELGWNMPTPNPTPRISAKAAVPLRTSTIAKRWA